MDIGFSYLQNWILYGFLKYSTTLKPSLRYIGPGTCPTEPKLFFPIFWNGQMHVHFELARLDFGDDFRDDFRDHGHTLNLTTVTCLENPAEPRVPLFFFLASLVLIMLT